MSEDTNFIRKVNASRAAIVYQITETIILGMSVLLVCWTANQVIQCKERLATHSTMIDAVAGRIDLIEVRGSESLTSYIKISDARFDRLDVSLTSALTTAHLTAGELKVIAARLENADKTMTRIERLLEEHSKEKP